MHRVNSNEHFIYEFGNTEMHIYCFDINSLKVDVKVSRIKNTNSNIDFDIKINKNGDDSCTILEVIGPSIKERNVSTTSANEKVFFWCLTKIFDKAESITDTSLALPLYDLSTLIF